MFATAVRCSKASRRALTPKRGNKDFYKGTRQSFLPGGRRTGAPGHHVVSGKAKYKLDDERVRVFVAPRPEDLNSSPLRPYVAATVKLSHKQKRGPFGMKLPQGGLDGAFLLNYLKKQLPESHQAVKTGSVPQELEIVDSAISGSSGARA